MLLLQREKTVGYYCSEKKQYVTVASRKNSTCYYWIYKKEYVTVASRKNSMLILHLEKKNSMLLLHLEKTGKNVIKKSFCQQFTYI